MYIGENGVCAENGGCNRHIIYLLDGSLRGEWDHRLLASMLYMLLESVWCREINVMFN